MSDETILQFIQNHPVRLVVYTLTSALGWLIAWGIRSWHREWVKRLCRGGHKKKYVEIGMYTNYDCKSHFQRHTENDEWWGTKARWICTEDGCAAYGEDCFGSKKIFWKIEHGQVVPDKKLMESPPTEILHPKHELARRRAKKEAAAPRELTFDEVFKATEQAMLKNMKHFADELDRRQHVVPSIPPGEVGVFCLEHRKVMENGVCPTCAEKKS